MRKDKNKTKLDSKLMFLDDATVCLTEHEFVPVNLGVFVFIYSLFLVFFFFLNPMRQMILKLTKTLCYICTITTIPTPLWHGVSFSLSLFRVFDVGVVVVLFLLLLCLRPCARFRVCVSFLSAFIFHFLDI